MLRLVLDALQGLERSGRTPDNHPLTFQHDSRWYSEARLISPFLRRPKNDIPDNETDTQGEGYTNADGVIGHFTFRKKTKAGLTLTESENKSARQFVVVEAKMFSPLSSGTQNAPVWNQAARTVACMAEIIRQSTISFDQFNGHGALGFFVVAPKKQLEKGGTHSLRAYLDHDALRKAIHQRLNGYDATPGSIDRLYQWKCVADQLLEHLHTNGRLAPLSWEDDVIKPFQESDDNIVSRIGDGLRSFFDSCVKYGKSKV